MAIRFAGILAASFFVMTMLSNAHAAPKIGVASAVQNSVVRVVGAGTQALSVGSDLFSNERIRTGDASTAQILLLDRKSTRLNSSHT